MVLSEGVAAVAFTGAFDDGAEDDVLAPEKALLVSADLRSALDLLARTLLGRSRVDIGPGAKRETSVKEYCAFPHMLILIL